MCAHKTEFYQKGARSSHLKPNCFSGIPEANANSTEELLNAEHKQFNYLIYFLGEQTNVQRKSWKRTRNQRRSRFNIALQLQK